MDGSLILLLILVTLLIGLLIGKTWERYKLHGGQWIDRRKSGESPHFIVGLNFLVSNQIDLAIEELKIAANLNKNVLEIHLILGNLYREKGQVGRAIHMHQDLLQRPRLTKLEHAHVLLCLGLDFKRGGFIDRAFEAFTWVLRLDPSNAYALLNLERLHEEQHQWSEAYAIRQQIVALSDDDHQPKNTEISAFLENELGLWEFKQSNHTQAVKHFKAAIELSTKALPAYLNLGDLYLKQGQDAEAVKLWEQLIQIEPERAYLVFKRLAASYENSDNPLKFRNLCKKLIDGNAKDWRARVALSQYLSESGSFSEAIDLLFEALVQNPHGLKIHQTIWQTLTHLSLDSDLVNKYIKLTRNSIFYLDPHVCMRCRYRSTELLWQCPQCHEWNSFTEERFAAAESSKDPSK